MRAEPELYKDKIEIALDGRQVFYLFFGGAVLACLVFVLGVMVGRRVEARAHVDRGAATSAARDPLAALDDLDASSRDDMSFRTQLAGGKAATSEVDQAVAAIEKSRAAARSEVGAKDKAAAKVSDEDESDDAEQDAAAKQAADEKKAAEAAKKAEKAEKDKAKKAAEAAKVAEAAKAVPDDDGRFTLQLSSFQERDDAESFQADMKATGYKAYLVEAEVEGKGTWFRVRYGTYDSYQAAIDAKDEFERKVQKIAYVTRL